MEEAGISVRTCSIIRVIFGNYFKADFLGLSKSQKLILQDVIPHLAALRTFYQRVYYNNRSHIQ